MSVHRWKKSTYSGSNGDCVEVAVTTGEVAVRDSKAPRDGRLRVSRERWGSFLGAVTSGRYEG